MRHVTGKLLGISLAVLFCANTAVVNAGPAGGITVSPAAIKLELHEGQQQTSAEFSIINRYQGAVNLHLGLEESTQKLPGRAGLEQQLSVLPSDVTIMPGETVKETVTWTDSQSWPPGSQQIDLVINQLAGNSSGVGVSPTIRLPLTAIKNDGAVAGLTLSQLSKPSISLGTPSSVGTTLKNTGNIVVIPHGIVTITAPDGTVVSKGVLNEQSAAISPGNSLELRTPLVKLAAATLPGTYEVNVAYGPGNDRQLQTAHEKFLYIAWWHIAGLLAVGTLIYITARNSKRIRQYFSRKSTPRTDPRPKRPMLIGRDIS